MIIIFILTVGIFSRLEVFLINRQLWSDEAALASNFFIHKGMLWVFKPLQFGQMSPPLFLLPIKFLTLIFGKQDWVFRLFPFLISVFSPPVFYSLSKKFLNSKPAIIFANFLFAVNFILLQYTTEVKQYSADVLVFAIILMWISNRNPNKINLKIGIKYSLAFTFLFFLSQPAIFILSGFILYSVLLNVKNVKNCLLLIIPLCFILLYKFSMPLELSRFMDNYWSTNEPGFFTLTNLDRFIKGNLSFFLIGAKYLIFLCPLSIIGFFILLIRKTTINNILVCSVVCALLASSLHLYPFVGRMIIYLYPFAFIYMAACFDIKIQNVRMHKFFSSILVTITLLFTILFLAKVFCKNRLNHLTQISQAKEITQILKDNYKKEDIIALPYVNETLFIYYSNYFKFNPASENILYVDFYASDLNKEVKLLESDRFYWVYLPYQKPPENKVIDWLNNQNVFYKIHLGRGGHLYKIKLNN